jgi:hypothetical protein
MTPLHKRITETIFSAIAGGHVLHKRATPNNP